MKLYIPEAEEIYFPQIKIYFREVVSSYDNGNYRSAMVMLYSTIVCDLLLKLKELHEIYSDQKAEQILQEVENTRQQEVSKSAWEKKLINKIHEETELLSDEAYTAIEHIYDYRNFSAHPALNDEYELISPTAEITVAYIKKALADILIKPSVFAQNIVDRMSDEIADKKAIYSNDILAFKRFLKKVYFERMSPKMATQVFKAFWKFTFIKKSDETLYQENRFMNWRTLEALFESFSDVLCNYVSENKNYFTVSQDSFCLSYLCNYLAFFPALYPILSDETKHQIDQFTENDITLIKWFKSGSISEHVSSFSTESDVIPVGLLNTFKSLCHRQGEPRQFQRFLIKHYSESDAYLSTKYRFNSVIKDYLELFDADDFVMLIKAIDQNNQIYGYISQKQFNNKIMDYAKVKLPSDFDFTAYPHFKFDVEDEEPEDTDEVPFLSEC